VAAVTKTAKRIVDRMFYYFEMMDVSVPDWTRQALEKVVADELQRHAKRDAMSGREEMDE